MSKLGIEKKKLEIIRVEAAKAEMKFKILERKEDIERLEKNIKIQEARALELKQEISNLGGE